MDEVLCICPGTILVVAKIIHDDNAQPRVDAFNAAIPSLVNYRAAEGYKVALVDMSGIGDPELHDGVHPNDQGYADMAKLWFQALQALPSDWLIAPGYEVALPSLNSGETCSNAATNGTGTIIRGATNTTANASSTIIASSISSGISMSSMSSISSMSSASSTSSPSNSVAPAKSSASRTDKSSTKLAFTFLLILLVLVGI